MEGELTNRRLAAILAADVVGYSRLMAADETGTLTALKRHREDTFNPAVARHRGRVVKLIGDGTLVEFTSVVDAVNCAVAIQETIGAVADTSDADIVLRIGINLGDVIIDDDDIYGDGVNIAARLEPLAKPGGVCVSSIVNESVRGRVETAFTDGGDVQVKNIDRPIRVWQWHPEHTPGQAELISGPSTAVAPGVGTGAPASPPVEEAAEGPSIAVLPFENMSGDAEQEYFSDGISEDIITDLSKVSGLLVIARNSSFAYKGRSVDLRTVGRDLGVGTVLEGSVRKAGNRVRITAQLIDTETGGHLWAERYDRDLTDIFAVQDEVTLSIVDALKVTLSPSEQAGIVGAGTTNLEAHDLYLRSRNLIVSPNQNAEVHARTVDYAIRAIELDPDYAHAYVNLAIAYVFDFLNRWSDDPDGALEKAADLAQRSVELAPDDPATHHAVSVVARWRKDLKLSVEAVERSLALNPNFPLAIFTRGVNEIFMQRPKAAIRDLERAMRLDPAFSQQHLHYLGLAHLLLGNNETAAMVFRERLLLAKDTDVGRALLAAALGHLGEFEEARQTWKDLMKINPEFSMEGRLARMPFADRSDADIITEGLTKAGLPD